MAQLKRALRENAHGEFFVDASCINCGVSRHYAPEVFGDTGDYAYVRMQPRTPEQELAARQALLACPVGAIGMRRKRDLQDAIDSFPLRLAPGVYLNGFNHRKSWGAHSYFIEDANGNWLIDSPRFIPYLVKRFEALGGLKYIFLTHADDVADARLFAERFQAKRIIHRLEAHAQQDAEIVLDGQADHCIAGARILFTPGHTRGHCVLLWENRYLFTGDHFAWLPQAGRFGSFRDACWHSWEQQIDSVDRLKACEGVEWVLPGHGRWGQVRRGDFPRIIEDAVRCMRTEAG